MTYYYVTVGLAFESDQADTEAFTEELHGVIRDIDFVDRFTSATRCVDYDITNVDGGEPTYKIVRFYRELDHPNHGDVIRTGLTLEEAQEHCNDPATREEGVWFDGYTEE